MGRSVDIDRQAVCAAYLAGETQRAIAERHGVTQPFISQIVKGILSATDRLAIETVQKSLAGKTRSRRLQTKKILVGTFSIEVDGDVLRASMGGVTFLFDPCDEAILRAYSWRVGADLRLTRQERDASGRTVNIYVYHDIMGVRPTRASVIDHINRDQTDNRRANLRRCSYSENNRNRGARIHHSSPSKGKGRQLNVA